ncbi:hypothetical protein [Actinokineospora inagensis]|uniref:hypothetical protein n=1 Tax=Actinokineospora inagensis TaxID=103730 RepID=UPI00316AC4CB
MLIDVNETALAVGQVGEARSLAEGAATPLLRSWVAAAHGESLAMAGHGDEALEAFDDANALLPNDPVDPDLPFVFLGGSHLDRWRGNTLAGLGDPDAISHLVDALYRTPPDFLRARVTMLVDLAYAHAAAGDRTAAQSYAREARRLGMQIKTDRLLRRLSQLVLPS